MTPTPSRSYDRAARRAAADHDRARVRPDGHRLGAHHGRRDARHLHRVAHRRRAALDGRQGPRLGHRRVRDASGLDGRPQAARRGTGRQDGRTVEIQRLIGRSLRGVVDFAALGENTIYLDCDVLTADGGTRCGVDHRRLRRARAGLRAPARRGEGQRSPLTGSLAAVSCGMVDGRAAARPRLRGGLDRRGRRQRRHDRRRRARRGPGDGRADPALAGAPRRAARARRQGRRGCGPAASCAIARRRRRSPLAGA